EFNPMLNPIQTRQSVSWHKTVMDQQEYAHLKAYLLYRRCPTFFNNDQQKRLEKQSKFFLVWDGVLYKKDRRQKNNKLKVLRVGEVDPILALVHDYPLGAHFGKDIMFNKIRDYYYWPQMYDDIREYVRTCERCQKQSHRKSKEPLHPIPVEAPFHKIGIDIVGPLPITPQSNKYIVVATNYMTKWPEARAIPRDTAEEVAKFVYEEIDRETSLNPTNAILPGGIKGGQNNWEEKNNDRPLKKRMPALTIIEQIQSDLTALDPMFVTSMLCPFSDD
ncbi:11605_t:CDS:2, partial [Cetraspora pellucida]